MTYHIHISRTRHTKCGYYKGKAFILVLIDLGLQSDGQGDSNLDVAYKCVCICVLCNTIVNIVCSLACLD